MKDKSNESPAPMEGHGTPPEVLATLTEGEPRWRVDLGVVAQRLLKEIEDATDKQTLLRRADRSDLIDFEHLWLEKAKSQSAPSWLRRLFFPRPTLDPYEISASCLHARNVVRAALLTKLDRLRWAEEAAAKPQKPSWATEVERVIEALKKLIAEATCDQDIENVLRPIAVAVNKRGLELDRKISFDMQVSFPIRRNAKAFEAEVRALFDEHLQEGAYDETMARMGALPVVREVACTSLAQLMDYLNQAKEAGQTTWPSDNPQRRTIGFSVLETDTRVTQYNLPLTRIRDSGPVPPEMLEAATRGEVFSNGEQDAQFYGYDNLELHTTPKITPEIQLALWGPPPVQEPVPDLSEQFPRPTPVSEPIVVKETAHDHGISISFRVDATHTKPDREVIGDYADGTCVTDETSSEVLPDGDLDIDRPVKA